MQHRAGRGEGGGARVEVEWVSSRRAGDAAQVQGKVHRWAGGVCRCAGVQVGLGQAWRQKLKALVFDSEVNAPYIQQKCRELQKDHKGGSRMLCLVQFTFGEGNVWPPLLADNVPGDKFKELASPWLITVARGAFRVGPMAFPLPGVGHLVVAIAGKSVVLPVPGSALLAAGLDAMDNLSVLLGNLTDEQARTFGQEVRVIEHSQAVWVPFGWVPVVTAWPGGKGQSFSSVVVFNRFHTAGAQAATPEVRNLIGSQLKNWMFLNKDPITNIK